MYSVKRFISVFLLCVILPFLSLHPLSSNADNGTFSVQGTEYQKPLFLSPDIDFSKYSHYFLFMYGSPDEPVYKLYAIENESVSEDFIRFRVSFTSDSTCFYRYGHTEHSVTTSYYRTTVFSFDTSTGLSSYSFLDNDIIGWVFDGYSTFDSSAGSSSKYIIGANCDIYDYAGNLLRAGDYGNLCSFFADGLKGSSDRSQNPLPAETTTSVSSSDSSSTGSSSGGGSGGNIDLGNIPDLLGSIFDKLGAIADSLNAVVTAISSKIIADRFDKIKTLLDEIKTLISNINGNLVVFEHLKNYLDKQFDNISLEISEFKKSFLEFASVNGEIKKLGELFSSINISLSNLKQGLENAVNAVKTDFNDFADDVKSNVSSIRLILNDFTGKLDTIVSKSSDIFTDLHSVREHTYNIRQHAYDCKARLFTIISKLDSILSSFDNHFNVDFKVEFNNFINSLNVGFAGLLASLGDIKAVIDGLSAEIGDIKLSTGDIKNSVSNNFSELISLIRSESQSIRNTINSLPESFHTLLEKLFIPKGDHFSGFDSIKERFGFVDQILKIGDVIVDSADFYEKPPVFDFDFSHELFGNFSVKLDFGIIPYKYVVFVRNFIRGITLIVFVRRTRKRLPDVINGCGG